MEKSYLTKNGISIYGYRNPASHGFFISLFLKAAGKKGRQERNAELQGQESKDEKTRKDVIDVCIGHLRERNEDEKGGGADEKRWRRAFGKRLRKAGCRARKVKCDADEECH